MNLTKTALKRPVSVLMIVLAIIIFGVSGATTAPLELTPDIEMPMMLIMTTYGGAGPTEVEDLVSKPIEDTVSTLSGIKNVTSFSRENLSFTMLEMSYGTNMDVAHMDLQEKLNMIKNDLPDDASTPVIVEMGMDMMPTVVLSANATGDIDLLNYVENDIKPEFSKLAGVASVDVAGGSEKYISVCLKEDKLRQYKLDMNTIIGFVGAADFSIPAGKVDRGDLNLSLRGGVSYLSAEALKSVPITLSSGKVIHLSDVADIYMADAESSSLSRYNGEESVILQVKKRQSASTLSVTEGVKKTVDTINSAKSGVELSVVMDTSTDILSAISSVVATLISGVILSMLVLFIFFGDWKASIIVGSSMPISVLTTVILMNIMGFSFNVVSLGGLVIGVGMMVDNSIVVIESCFRQRDRQRSFYESAIEGTKLVTSSVIASTLTTVVVFFPIGVMKGMSGQLFRQLSFTIIFSLTASLISAMTLVPLLFMKMQAREKKEMFINKILAKVQRVYGNFLKKTFSKKKWVVLFSVALLIGSFMMALTIPFELMPSMDQGTIEISVETKPGLNLDTTDALLRELEEMVSQTSDVERYSLSAQSGTSTINAYLKGDREKSTDEWVDIWREQTKDRIDTDISINASSGTAGMSGGSGVDVNLQGNDLEVLRNASKQVEDLLATNKDIVRVSSTLTSGNPQAEVVVDPMKATAVGLTPKQVIGTVYNVMSGNSPDDLMIDGREYEIRVEYPEDRYQSVTDLAGLMLSTPSGRQVPLLDIAKIEYSNSPQSIDRKNGQYIVTVSATPTTATELTAQGTVDEMMKTITLPDGVSVTKNAQSEQMAEEFGALLGAIITAVLLVLMVMAMQFESLKFALIVMICIPFSLIGSFLLLILSKCSISMTALMGFLTLVGTVINNGILFIDTANQYRTSMDAETALITAGRTRLRPILMTTLTTVLAMVPMALGIGSGSETMQGMAVVIIGGLVASTILSLLLLPTFYLLFGGKPRKYGNDDTLVPPKPEESEFSVEDLMQS